MIIKVKHLGLAAYIVMRGTPLKHVEKREFVFDSALTEKEWRVQYNNSCCMVHDAMVCELRHHLKECENAN